MQSTLVSPFQPRQQGPDLISKIVSIGSAYRAAKGNSAAEYVTRLVLESISKIMPDFSGSVVLDLGCGSGNQLFGSELSNAGCAIGIDLSAEQIRKNRLVRSRIVANAQNMPLASSCLDFIVSTDAIEHIEDPLLLLRECYRVLKPSGRAIFASPSLLGYKTLLARYGGKTFSRFAWRVIKRTDHPPWTDFYRANSPWKIRALCRKADLILDDIVFLPEISHFLYGFPLFFAAARAWDVLLEFTGLRCFHNYIAYVLRKPDLPTLPQQSK